MSPVRRSCSMSSARHVMQGCARFSFANSNIAVVAKAVGTRKASINPLGYQWDKEMKAVAELLR